MHDDLAIACIKAYIPNGMVCHNVVEDLENKAYGACVFDMNQKHIAFRAAKITPTKNGQFVVFWKRAASGETIPYDTSDAFDMLIISVRNGDQLGQFIFPKSVLSKYGLISTDGKGGKRAMRVYPPWDIPESAQATKTQVWQMPYFVLIHSSQGITDHERIRKLLS